MNHAGHARRLVRATELVQKLRQLELIELKRLAAEAARTRSEASGMDALAETGPSAWALFPNCWMAHRAKLEARISDIGKELDARSKSAYKLKIMARQLGKKAAEEGAAFELRRTSDAVAEYIARNAGKPQKGSGKLDEVPV